MEDKTTITDNEVIARFMSYFNWEDSTCGNYDKDWNRLMPVWYKFRDLDSYSLDLAEYSTYRYYWNTIANDIPRKPIADVCTLLAEGIRWYNSTTQNKEQS